MSEQAMTDTQRVTGGCQCGAVRYAFRGAPARIGLCHCRMCQKAVGGPFGVWAVVPLASFTWTRGAPATWASSSVATRDYCAGCGTPLSLRDIGGPTIELLAGTLDQPEQAIPTYEVGIEGKLAWLAALPGLPGKTTLETSDVAATLVNHQHPDHDTDGTGWPRR